MSEIKRALLSVYDKTGIKELAAGLVKQGVEIISSGGTASYLIEQDIPVTTVSSITGFPEIMDGRLKTLHPKILGGILGLRDAHAEEAKVHGLSWFDMVVSNLYPFEETVTKNKDD